MLLVLFLACSAPNSNGPDESYPDSTDTSAETGTDGSGTTDDGRGPRPVTPPTTMDAPARVVSFADVHGDFRATLDVLELAGLIDEDRQWVGEDTVVVQVGDQLDRGDDERAILHLFEELSDQAWEAGGGFYPLLGNHETMNVELDFRYVTDGGFADFADVPYDEDDPVLSALSPSERGRAAAFRPGGPYAQILSTHNMVMQVGDTVFVHGGVLPQHASVGLERINADVQEWMRGDGPEPERWLAGDGPVWTRLYSDDDEAPECDTLEDALDRLGAARMVVGHTVQDQANPACDGRVWRMDVGMAAHYGGTPAALEIRGDDTTLLEARR